MVSNHEGAFHGLCDLQGVLRNKTVWCAKLIRTTGLAYLVSYSSPTDDIALLFVSEHLL